MNVAAGQSQDRAYIALLGLAEHYRTTNNFKKAIQCLVKKIVQILIKILLN